MSVGSGSFGLDVKVFAMGLVILRNAPRMVSLYVWLDVTLLLIKMVIRRQIWFLSSHPAHV
jgi:hypothetical protein